MLNPSFIKIAGKMAIKDIKKVHNSHHSSHQENNNQQKEKQDQNHESHTINPNADTSNALPPDYTKITYEGEQISATLPYKNHKLHGQARFYSNGELTQIITYKDGIQDGPFSSYKKHQLLLTCHYLNGVKNGGECAFDTKGNPLIYTEYINGIKNGKQITYQEGIMVSLINYINDIKEGSFMDYFPNGMMRQTGIYKNDKLDGIVTIFNDKGGIIVKTRYIDGVKV